MKKIERLVKRQNTVCPIEIQNFYGKFLAVKTKRLKRKYKNKILEGLIKCGHIRRATDKDINFIEIKF